MIGNFIENEGQCIGSPMKRTKLLSRERSRKNFTMIKQLLAFHANIALIPPIKFRTHRVCESIRNFFVD